MLRQAGTSRCMHLLISDLGRWSTWTTNIMVISVQLLVKLAITFYKWCPALLKIPGSLNLQFWVILCMLPRCQGTYENEWTISEFTISIIYISLHINSVIIYIQNWTNMTMIFALNNTFPDWNDVAMSAFPGTGQIYIASFSVNSFSISSTAELKTL